MKYVRIKVYENGKFNGCEHAYLGDSHAQAMERFAREYPENAKLSYMAHTIDDKDPEWEGWFRAARRCGCVHCF